MEGEVEEAEEWDEEEDGKEEGEWLLQGSDGTWNGLRRR